MKIIVVGGSNSVMNGGYRTVLEDLCKTSLQKAKVVNLAIGDTNSSMAVYQLLSFKGLEKNDIIVWEYALNDAFGLHTRPQTWYLQLIEAVIRFSIEKQCKLIPVLLQTKGEDKKVEPTLFRATLHHLFNSYGVKVLDVGTETRAQFNVQHLDETDYKDVFHYQLNGRVVKLIASEIVDRVKSRISKPRMVPKIYMKEGYKIAYFDEFSGPAKRKFKNSLVDVDYHDLRDGPATFTVPQDGCRVIATVGLISPHAGDCLVQFPNYAVVIAMQPRQSFETRVLLKSFFGERATQNVPVNAGDQITFSEVPGREDPQSEGEQKARGISGVLCEVPDSKDVRAEKYVWPDYGKVLFTSHGTVLRLGKDMKFTQDSKTADLSDAVRLGQTKLPDGTVIIGSNKLGFYAVQTNGKYLSAMGDKKTMREVKLVGGWELFASK